MNHAAINFIKYKKEYEQTIKVYEEIGKKYLSNSNTYFAELSEFGACLSRNQEYWMQVVPAAEILSILLGPGISNRN